MLQTSDTGTHFFKILESRFSTLTNRACSVYTTACEGKFNEHMSKRQLYGRLKNSNRLKSLCRTIKAKLFPYCQSRPFCFIFIVFSSTTFTNSMKHSSCVIPLCLQIRFSIVVILHAFHSNRVLDPNDKSSTSSSSYKSFACKLNPSDSST